MFCLVFLLCRALGKPELPVGLVTSEFTGSALSASLREQLSGLSVSLEHDLNLPFKLQVYWVELSLGSQVAWELPAEILNKDPPVLIDFTRDADYGQFLASLAVQKDFIHFVVGRPLDEFNGEEPSPGSFYLETPLMAESTALVALIKNYNWNSLALICDSEYHNEELTEMYRFYYDSTSISITDEIATNKEDRDLPKTLKARLDTTTADSRAKTFLVATDPLVAAHALWAGDNAALGGAGYAWVLSSYALRNLGQVALDSHADESPELFGVLKTGAVGFSEEDADYKLAHPLCTLEWALTLIGQGYSALSFPSAQVSVEQFKEYVLGNPLTPSSPIHIQFSENGVKVPYLSLYNMQEFQLHKVGHYENNEIVITGPIVWPGLESVAPSESRKIINLVLLYPLHDQRGYEFPEGASIRRGFDLALEEVNADPQLIPGYTLQAIYKDTFMSTALAPNILKSVTNLNIAGFVGPYDNNVALAFQRELNVVLYPKPMVSYATGAFYFNASDIYPGYLRLIQPDGLEAVALSMFIQQENLRRVGIIYTKDALGLGVYDSLMGNVDSLQLTVVNDVEKRGIFFDDSTPSVLTAKTLEDCEMAVTELVRKQIKIIIYLGNDVVGAEVAKLAAEKELWGSEYVWLGTRWLTTRLQQFIDSEYSGHKDGIYKVLNSAIGMDYRGPVGTEGSGFVERFLSRWGSNYTTFSMYAYDSVYLFANSIHAMVLKGDDFLDSEDLMDSMRSADFTAASGKLKFTEGTNDRSAIGYTVTNVQDQELLTVLVYDPLDSEIFIEQESVTLKWTSGSEPADDEWPEEEQIDCPFAYHMRTISWGGLGLIVAIGIALSVLTLVLSFRSFQKWKMVDIKVISNRVTRSWKDTFVQATIAIEFFQFIAIAPSFPSLRIVVEAAANIFMVDIVKISQGSKSSYWELLVIVCVICYIWFFLVLLIMLDAERWLGNIPAVQRIFNVCNAIFLPFIGNTMFLPFMALLLDALVCDYKAQGYAIVRRDCYKNCWTGDHIVYAAMASVAVVMYQPVAAYSRPLWQQARSGLNIMAKPYFLLFKTCVQILLIAIGKTLQGISPIAHGCIFTILSFGFAILTYRMKPFNYERCNLYEFTTLLAVSYLAFLATISFTTEDPAHFGWFVGLMAGWIVMGLVVYYMQKNLSKYQKMLMPPGNSKKRNRIQDIFKVEDGESEEDYEKVHKGQLQMYGKAPTPVPGFDGENCIDDQVSDIERSHEVSQIEEREE